GTLRVCMPLAHHLLTASISAPRFRSCSAAMTVRAVVTAGRTLGAVRDGSGTVPDYHGGGRKAGSREVGKAGRGLPGIPGPVCLKILRFGSLPPGSDGCAPHRESPRPVCPRS